MKQTFFIPGPLPGLNDFEGNKRWAYRKAKSNWTLIISIAIKQAKLKPVKRAFIQWEWVEPAQRRDPDNFTSMGRKFALDSLVKCGILPDDGWNEVVGWVDSWLVDKDKPGVYVTLEER